MVCSKAWKHGKHVAIVSFLAGWIMAEMIQTGSKVADSALLSSVSMKQLRTNLTLQLQSKHASLLNYLVCRFLVLRCSEIYYFDPQCHSNFPWINDYIGYPWEHMYSHVHLVCFCGWDLASFASAMDAKKNTIAFPDLIMPLSRCLRHSIKRYQKAKYDWCHWCILMHDWKPELLVFSIGVLEPPMCVFFRPNWIWNSDTKWHWHCFLLEFLQGDGKYQKKNAELATAATIGWPEGWLWTKRNPQHLLCAAPCLRTCPHRLCLTV